MIKLYENVVEIQNLNWEGLGQWSISIIYQAIQIQCFKGNVSTSKFFNLLNFIF